MKFVKIREFFPNVYNTYYRPTYETSMFCPKSVRSDA